MYKSILYEWELSGYFQRHEMYRNVEKGVYN